jgi:hypothetical protein
MPPPPPRCSGWVTLRSFSQPYQPSPIPLSGRPAHRPFRGLLGVHSRCGMHTLAVTVFRDRYPGASAISSPPCLPRLLPAEAISPGGPCAHWKTPPCHGAHPLRTFPRAAAASPMRQEPADVVLRFPTIAWPSAIPRMVPNCGIGFLTVPWRPDPGRQVRDADDKKERSARDTSGPRGFHQSDAS